ncbi:MAG: hypothetical protein K0R14_1247 [Burkholderiales bacterium]|jgi:hypothetical protein|nr:hypothetical protein [Burkholderiales bacterium]
MKKLTRSFIYFVLLTCWVNMAAAFTWHVYNSTGLTLDHVTVKVVWGIYDSYGMEYKDIISDEPLGTLNNDTRSEFIDLGYNSPNIATQYTEWYVEYSWSTSGMYKIHRALIPASDFPDYRSFSVDPGASAEIKITGIGPDEMRIQVITGSDPNNNSDHWGVTKK